MPSEKLFAKITISSILLISILVIAMSCKECPTEPEYDISLSVEDIACVWVTFNVILPDSGKINTFTLERNDSTVATYTCYDDDTLIIDDGLTPDNDYSYTVRFLKDGQTKAESDPIVVHTLPTTSHDFTWVIDTLGHYGSSLKDIWIVDENNIWVVGNIETDSGTFNAAMWDGTYWNLIQVHNLAPLYSIWYFSDDNIWVSSGFPKHWDGNQWTMYHLQNMGLGSDVSTEYIWASSPNNIYFVGYQGSIVYYNGSNFSKISSETEINLTDVYGSPDGSEVWTCGFDNVDGSVLLKKEGNTFKKIAEVNPNTILGQPGKISHVFEGIWTDNSNYLYIGATGRIYIVPENSTGNADDLIWWDYNTELGYPPRTSAICGFGSNDIFICGIFGSFIHYNGQDFQNYELNIPDSDFFKMEARENMVAACGQFLSWPLGALVVTGKR